MRYIVYICLIVLTSTVVACNGESSNGTDEFIDEHATFKNFEDLSISSPCDNTMNGKIVHVQENNLDYVCSYDCRQNKWSWMVYSSIILQQPCRDETNILSSNTFVLSSSVESISLSSSSLKKVLSSSSLKEMFLESSSSIRENWKYLNSNYAYGEIVDKRDNQTYKTTTIGSQTWLAENLRYVPYNSSVLICFPDASEGMRVKYGNVCDRNGYFYSWAEAIDNLGEFSGDGAKCASHNNHGLCPVFVEPIRGVCPEGWHLPQKLEYEELIEYVKNDSRYRYGSPKCGLISIDVWEYQARCGAVTDDFGFSMLPSGVIRNDKFYNGEETMAGFWTSTPDVEVSDDAYDMLLFGTNAFYNPVGGRVYTIKTYDDLKLDFYRDSIYEKKIQTRFPVRCLKDN